MGLRDIGETLPPGFRFYPSDEELICHYLYKKIANEEVVRGTLVEIDLHTCEPWQLPEVAKLNSDEWYFFSFRDRKYATGYRTNRATTTGYWKATGKDRTVLDPRTQTVVGMRKTLVFHKNRAPNGIKTGWIMHEFRLENHHLPPKEDWVLCRVFHKSRGENGNKLLFSPQNFQDSNTDGVNLDAVLPQSPTNERALSSGGTYRNIVSFSHSPSHDQNPSTAASLAAAGGLLTTVLDHSSTGCCHLHLSQYHHHDMINESHHHHPSTSTYNNLNEIVDHNTKCDDGSGFLFDMMGFEDDPTRGLMPSSFADDI